MILDKNSSLRVAEIYPTFNGEQNTFGIGSPTIFLRLAGCHIRCYLATKGMLCDTPNFLNNLSGDEFLLDSIVRKVKEIRENTGISLICISGGDPLARSTESLASCIALLLLEDFSITIETSGTISIKPLLDILEKEEDTSISMAHDLGDLSFILDWKTPSAGIKAKCRVEEDLDKLNTFDYIKFVVDDEEDYRFTRDKINIIKNETLTNIAVGPYWGGKISPFDLFNKLKSDNLTGRIVMNFQVHKMAIASDYNIETNSKQI